VTCPPAVVHGASVREVLDTVFADNPQLAGYIVDDQGALRKHIAVFIDGKVIEDRERQSDSVGEDSEIYVLQALSGG
jgi:hypothetical protein